MKDRLLTLALAIGALAAFYVLFAPKPEARERVTRPVSTEAGPNGYVALQRWLAAEHVPILSLRERYGSLAGIVPAAPTGNLLIATAPQVYPLRTSESQPLKEWIAAGNTLLVLAGLSDTPEWSMGEGFDSAFLEHLKLMTGLTFVAIPPADAPSTPPAAGEPEAAAEATTDAEQPDQEDEQSPPTPPDTFAALQRLGEVQRTESSPNGRHVLLDGVRSIVAVSEYPSAHMQAASEHAVLLELASDHSSGVPSLWLLPYGDGQIIVSAYGSIFTNKVLGEGDNARLLANLVHWSLGAKGHVIIDDAHQGLVSFYDPDKFFGDSRLHRALWWLLALWLVFVLGPRRLRAAAAHWSPVDITSFVRATGGFMARVLRPAAAGQQLFANFFNEIRNRTGLSPNGAPVWDWLGTRATIPPRHLERLQELHRRVLQRQRIDLPELYNLMIRVRALLI